MRLWISAALAVVSVVAPGAVAQAEPGLFPLSFESSFDGYGDARNVPPAWRSEHGPLPASLETMPDGRLVVSAQSDGALWFIDERGLTTTVGAPRDDEYGAGDSVHLAASADGTLLVADDDNIWRFASGRFTRLAGADAEGDGSTADGIRALDAGLLIGDVATLPDGSWLIADRRTLTVRRVDASGTISTFAGNRAKGQAVDGAIATDTPLPEPRALAVTAGGVLIATADGRVWIVTPDGRLHTWPSTAHRGHVNDLTALRDGSVAVLDERDGIYRVAPDGSQVRVIRTRDDANDPYRVGRPLSQAMLGYPYALAEDPLGGLAVLTGGDGLVSLPIDGGARQSVAISPDTLRLARRGRATFIATLGGTAQLRLIRGRRVVASRTLTLPPGRSVVTLPKTGDSRVHTLAITVEAPDGRSAADVMPLIPGPLLSVRDAARTLELHVLIDDGDLGVGTRAEDCRRIDRLRVRCRVLLYDAQSGAPPRKSVLGHVTVDLFLDARGRPRIRGTSATRDASAIVLLES